MSLGLMQGMLAAGGVAPPTGIPVPAANTSALLHMDGANGSTTFTDQTGKVWTPNGGVQITTAQSVFGGASGRFDAATSPYITTPNHADFAFGTGDFTVSCWVYHDTPVNFNTLYNHGYTVAGALLIQSTGNAGASARQYTVYMNGVAIFTESSSIAGGTFVHYELVRVSGVVTLRRNGIATGSAVNATNINPGTTVGFGARIAPAQVFFNGYIDELLVLKGLALHTANFTPPTQPYVIV